MEQRDYLLREIEKIGMVMRAIRQKLFGGTDGLAVTVEAPAEALKEMLKEETLLDLDELLAMDATATEDYLARLKGFNTEIIELLAATLADIAFMSTSADSPLLLQKALHLYEICSLRDRTYSFSREAQIKRIREFMNIGI
ncbi:hypothetical protein EG830_07800 [bacterium]|nr:hypothetical protein [bacterium]